MIFNETYLLLYNLPGLSLLLEMSFYLLFGFFVAGLLKLFISQKYIEEHLSGEGFWQTFKAAAFGVPLPICSCGVIPVSEHLLKSNASKSSVISFLVSTPTTGVDSILATYSLLGPLYAAFRPVASFLGGIITGLAVSLFSGRDKNNTGNSDLNKNACETDVKENDTIKQKVISAFKYAFGDLVEATGKWILIGIIAGALISIFIPRSFVETYLSNRAVSYLLMLAVGIPMYICATGSIPIAASLVMKGMSPGAALVFLIAGPATNTASIAFVAGRMGKKTALVYLISIIFISLLFAFVFDVIAAKTGFEISDICRHSEILPRWLKVMSSVVLLLLILRPILKNRSNMKGEVFYISDITCSHCAKRIEEAVKRVEGVEKASVNVKNKQLTVEGKYCRDDILEAIRKTGYTV